MTGQWARSLSERLDRDGADSVLRKAAKLGPQAKEVGRVMVAMDGGMRQMRAVEIKSEVAEDKLAGIVALVDARLGEPAGTDSLDVRKPPFPDGDEELRDMAEENGGRQAGEATAAVPVAAAPAVRRGSESEASSSGVINLKALADDYHRQKAQKAEKSAAAAQAPGARAQAEPAERRRSPVPVLIAVACGLVAVAGVLVYLMVSGRSRGNEGAGRAAAGATGGPTIAAATEPSVPAEKANLLADQQAALEARLAARESGASQEEIERLRKEIEELKAQRSAATGPGTQVPADQPPAAAADPAGRPGPAAGAHATARSSGGASAGGRPANGGRPTTPPARDAGATSAATPGPPSSSVVSMLGGARTGAGAASAPPRNPAGSGTGTATAPAGDRSGTVVAGSLNDVLGTRAPPAETAHTAPAPAPPPVAVPPPPPVAPAAEVLPEIPGRAEIRRATDSVKSAIFNCGSGQTGTITVQFTVSGTDGSVTDARVTGGFAGTAVGACAERAARSATFPRFHRATFTVPFPFVLPAQ